MLLGNGKRTAFQTAGDDLVRRGIGNVGQVVGFAEVGQHDMAQALMKHRFQHLRPVAV